MNGEYSQAILDEVRRLIGIQLQDNEPDEDGHAPIDPVLLAHEVVLEDRERVQEMLTTVTAAGLLLSSLILVDMSDRYGDEPAEVLRRLALEVMALEPAPDQ